MENKSSQIVTFVVDKDLDIKNHLIALNSYKRNIERDFKQEKNNSLENLLKLGSEEEIHIEIEKSIQQYYKQEDKLYSLTDDINNEWVKIEKDFINRLEKIHKFPFPYKSVKGVLSSASRFGYDTKQGWFATTMFSNKFLCIDTATHELMHFMFHNYYDQVCKEKGLSANQMWDVKESFTVLLNIEFSNFRFRTDYGYLPNKKIRDVVQKSWEINHDFNKALDDAIDYVKNN